jgi:Di-haem oxidoreductase, putative peroxidase
MGRSKRVLIIFVWCLLGASMFLHGSTAQTETPSRRKVTVPKIWDAKALATWATPLAGVNATPNFYSEEEYYAAPVDNLRTYPIYHPDREPAGYKEWLKKQGAQPLIEPEKLKTEQDWIEAGRRVFDELDIPTVRTSDPRIFEYLRDREALKKSGHTITKGGVLLGLRWVVEKDGTLKVGLSECASCHTRVLDDGTLIRGAQGNVNLASPGIGMIVEGFIRDQEKRGISFAEGTYSFYGVPWIKDDVHERFKKMSVEEISAIDGPPMPGTFARFNGSPYFITKIPDLIGIKDRRYLDHTATHLNRGPEDIARYGALVATADDGAVGPYKFFTDEQRRLPYRYSDEALYALGKFIYSLEPPPNPNKVDAQARRGQEIFKQEGCEMCHTPPLYTNNKLVPVDGFTPARGDARVTAGDVVKGVSIGTDPSLALKTRKGTGYYKVPSLKGLWYRGLIEHSGSIASLEEWFDRDRLKDEYVPKGWKGPGVKSRAVKGHEFGLELSPEDKRALIAFLKTL